MTPTLIRTYVRQFRDADNSDFTGFVWLDPGDHAAIINMEEPMDYVANLLHIRDYGPDAEKRLGCKRWAVPIENTELTFNVLSNAEEHLRRWAERAGRMDKRTRVQHAPIKPEFFDMEMWQESPSPKRLADLLRLFCAIHCLPYKSADDLAAEILCKPFLRHGKGCLPWLRKYLVVWELSHDLLSAMHKSVSKY